MRILHGIVNVQTFVVIALAMGSTWGCLRLGIAAEFPLTLIATAIIFPIVFSIGGAYKRREEALKAYGELKAHGRAIYFAARDWIEDPEPALLEHTREALFDLFRSCRDLFSSPLSEMEQMEERVYATFSALSRVIRSFRAAGLATGEVSRCNQYLSKSVIAFETIKHIYQYRTPRTLRVYSKLFIYLMPVAYGPYYAAIAQEYSPGLEYMMPVLMSMILVCLDNIQDHLENPFDQVGRDDVFINAEKFVARLAAGAPTQEADRAAA